MGVLSYYIIPLFHYRIESCTFRQRSIHPVEKVHKSL